MGTEWPSGIKRRFQRAPSPVRTRPRAASLSGQATVQKGETAIPWDTAETYGCPNKNSANQVVLVRRLHDLYIPYYDK